LIISKLHKEPQKGIFIKQLIISDLKQFNKMKNLKHIDYQRVSQCSMAFRIEKNGTLEHLLSFYVLFISFYQAQPGTIYLKHRPAYPAELFSAQQKLRPLSPIYWAPGKKRLGQRI